MEVGQGRLAQSPKDVLASGMNLNDTFQLPSYEKRRQLKELNRVQRNTDQQNARVTVQPQKQPGYVGGRRQPIVGKGEVGAGYLLRIQIYMTGKSTMNEIISLIYWSPTWRMCYNL